MIFPIRPYPFNMLNATMRGVAMVGEAYSVSVLDLPMPTILSGTDAIVRMNASAICGTDLHWYHEPLGSPEQPYTLGHEGIGYVTEIGDAVTSLNVGDYVVISDFADDGHFNYLDAPPNSTFIYSGPLGESLGGMQAEYVRVPSADNSLFPVPVDDATDRSTLYDYLFVSDIFATGWSALDYSGFEPGDSVAVWGAGGVGLLAAHSAAIRGASRVYVVDMYQDRLDLAASIGAVPVNFNETAADPVAAILAMEAEYGDAASKGVRRGIDAVGYEAVNATTGEVDASVVPRELLRVVGPGGGIGIVGVYEPGQTNFDVGAAFAKHLSVAGQATLPAEFARQLVPLIQAGRAKPSFVVSQTIGIEEAPEYYARFDRREETKVVINFSDY